MKKSNSILSIISILFLFAWGNVFAETIWIDQIKAQSPKECPAVENVIEGLDISSVSSVSDHSFNIKKRDSFNTNYKWNFSVEHITANSNEEALTIIKNILRTLPSSTIITMAYQSNMSSRSDCFLINNTYALHHLIQCTGFWTLTCKEQFQ